MNLHSIELWLAALVGTVALWAAFGIFSRWCAHSPAVPAGRLEGLRVGMSQQEVTALLGRPREVRHGAEDVVCWYYGSRLKRHVLIVEFNSAGRVLQFAYGIPDGRRATTNSSH